MLASTPNRAAVAFGSMERFCHRWWARRWALLGFGLMAGDRAAMYSVTEALASRISGEGSVLGGVAGGGFEDGGGWEVGDDVE